MIELKGLNDQVNENDFARTMTFSDTQYTLKQDINAIYEFCVKRLVDYDFK